jgi:hypothetical protein
MSLEQTNSKHVRVVPLSVSQNTALERLDNDFAIGIPFDNEELFDNNAVNTCAFISVTLAHLLLSDTELTNILQHAMQDKIIETAEQVINNFPRYFNMLRDPDRMYDAQEACQILQKAGVINKLYDLTEEIISSSCVFSTNGEELLRNAILNLQRQSGDSKVAVAIYTCGKYVLLIGCVAGKVFLVDSHPVVERACGEKTGVAIFSEGHASECHEFIREWLVKRLKRSGVTGGSMQSFAIMR